MRPYITVDKKDLPPQTQQEVESLDILCRVFKDNESTYVFFPLAGQIVTIVKSLNKLKIKYQLDFDNENDL